jgi:hypothetical protein
MQNELVQRNVESINTLVSLNDYMDPETNNVVEVQDITFVGMKFEINGVLVFRGYLMIE